MNRLFTVDGLIYEVNISLYGQLSFSLIGGNSRKGATYVSKRDKYNLFADDGVYHDVDLAQSAFPVYAKAGKFFTDWIYASRPHRFGFSASTDRKVKIYRWFAKKLEKKFPNYQAVEYPEGTWAFYKRQYAG